MDFLLDVEAASNLGWLLGFVDVFFCPETPTFQMTAGPTGICRKSVDRIHQLWTTFVNSCSKIHSLTSDVLVKAAWG